MDWTRSVEPKIMPTIESYVSHASLATHHHCWMNSDNTIHAEVLTIGTLTVDVSNYLRNHAGRNKHINGTPSAIQWEHSTLLTCVSKVEASKDNRMKDREKSKGWSQKWEARRTVHMAFSSLLIDDAWSVWRERCWCAVMVLLHDRSVSKKSR